MKDHEGYLPKGWMMRAFGKWCYMNVRSADIRRTIASASPQKLKFSGTPKQNQI